MAYRMTKEELDKEFEQFLRESVSDDSVELGSSSTRPSVLDQLGKPLQKQVKKSQVSVPWWQDEDDDSEEALGKGLPDKPAKCRFIKGRNIQAVDDHEESPLLVPNKPTPKPRSKAPDRVSYLDKPKQKISRNSDRQRGTEHHTTSSKNWPSNENSDSEQRGDSEDGFLTESSVLTPGNSDSTPRQSSPVLSDSAHSVSESSENDSSNCGNGVTTLGKTFCKSLRMSQPIQEVDEEQLKERCFENDSRMNAVNFSRDSLEPEDSLMMSGSALKAAMLDQDMEEKEKASFFAYLDRQTKDQNDDTILNKERESSSSTVTSLKRGGAVTLPKQHQSDNDGVKHSSEASPAYSEDFEDEASEKETEEKKPERRGMLAKVSLHDSLNSTDGPQVPAVRNYATARSELPESRMAEEVGLGPAGQSYVQSGVSEVEALQEAYRQISHSVGECEEEKVQEPSRSPASPATPEYSRGTFKHVSTAESDLPTAEELMQAIGPETRFTYGFSLQPVSDVRDVSAEMMVSENLLKGRAKSEDSAGDLRGTDRESPAEKEPPSPHQRDRNIAEEVRRLMQEQEGSQERPIVSSKSKRQQVPGRPVASTLSAAKKAPVPCARTKKTETRPLLKPSATIRTSRTAKPPAPLAQKKNQSQIKSKAPVLSQTHVVKGSDSDLRVNNELLASMQSFAAFLQHQIEVSNLSSACAERSDSNTQQATENNEELLKELHAGSGQDLPQECSSLERVPLHLAQRERPLLLREEQLQKVHSKEISALRQENYMLQSKLHRTEETSKKHWWTFGEAFDPVTEEKLRLLEKEMKEQETLIQGYQLENEKLYKQMKAFQALSKENEEAMFTENQRLLSELAITKEQLNRNSKQKTVESVTAANQGYSVTELMAEVQTAQRKEAQLQEEIHRLKQDKQALQVDFQMMKKERDFAKAQVIYTSGDKGFELRLREEKHKQEVSELKKRLQWYADNQELLDKDAARLRAANAEVQSLTEQVEKLKTEVAKRTNQQHKKAKERAGETKRIQDLERQVKEMEEILRRRHPNSLPALIFAAAAVGEETEGSSNKQTISQPSQTTVLLERRIRRLEAELEGCDEEAKRSLRAMEQQFHRIKLQYEQQISELEQRLAERSPENQGHLSLKSAAQAEPQHDELHQLKEAHQSQVTALKAEVASLQEQLHQARTFEEPEKLSRSPSRHQKQAEAAQTARIERLTQELSAKSHTIKDLHRTVERLQRERRTMLSAPKAEASSTKHRQHNPVPAKEQCPVPAETFPATQDERDYEPGAFSGSHISEVQKENDRLTLIQERLELKWEQERITLQAAITQACSELQRVEERSLEQLASLKAEHQREIEHLMARHALEHSSSKVVELAKQLETQEIMGLHLREQVKELQSTKDALAVSKLREETLQNQLAKLLEELKQAKEAHSPELRHFTSLEQKILSMELRYNQREQELQQMIAQTRLVVEQEQQAEVASWKQLAQRKSNELEAFRLELDSILDMLRELQRQGVVIPATQHSSSTGFVFRPLRS